MAKYITDLNKEDITLINSVLIRFSLGMSLVLEVHTIVHTLGKCLMTKMVVIEWNNYNRIHFELT